MPKPVHLAQSLMIVAAVVMVAACQPAPEISRPTPPHSATCDLSLQSEVGNQIATGSVPNRNNYRIIRPGDAVTKDYRTNRTNIYLDDNDRIVRVVCG